MTSLHLRITWTYSFFPSNARCSNLDGPSPAGWLDLMIFRCPFQSLILWFCEMVLERICDILPFHSLLVTNAAVTSETTWLIQICLHPERRRNQREKGKEERGWKCLCLIVQSCSFHLQLFIYFYNVNKREQDW